MRQKNSEKEISGAKRRGEKSREERRGDECIRKEERKEDKKNYKKRKTKEEAWKDIQETMGKGRMKRRMFECLVTITEMIR